MIKVTRYKNPPIVEAFVEIRFPPSVSWDMTIPGRLYEKLRNDFPKTETQILQEIQVNPSPLNIQHQITNQLRSIFKSQDDKQIIQVGEYLIAVNRLAPYLGWENFRPLVNNAINSLSEIINFENLQRIGLVYINRIEIPKNASAKLDLLQSHFNFGIFAGEQIPRDFVSFISGCVFSFEKDLCKVELTEQLHENPQILRIILNFDYFTAPGNFVPKGNIMDWIDNAHQNIETLFEAIITDDLRNSFGKL